ncbi:hypothetical protein FAIPA1_110113 [Frankia sp. AiPs1]|uniref:hypothetical protein n=1 Tax=Frankia sp. AiPa1 TaxID=573492 RepID=UPI00202B5548|nr:hypothetical protein [Frankia sp. AiPa1]MCL9757728.1 hypothetical protein [Frankia sp. AiPa1]
MPVATPVLVLVLMLVPAMELTSKRISAPMPVSELESVSGPRPGLRGTWTRLPSLRPSGRQ